LQVRSMSARRSACRRISSSVSMGFVGGHGHSPVQRRLAE
jgi:hypothetical protein